MNIYLIAVLAILGLGYALDTITGYLNLKHLGLELPEECQGIYDAERYQTSQQYLRETSQLDLIHSSIALVLTVLELISPKMQLPAVKIKIFR